MNDLDKRFAILLTPENKYVIVDITTYNPDDGSFKCPIDKRFDTPEQAREAYAMFMKGYEYANRTVA